MPRARRQAPGGIIYHVLNRAVGHNRIFDDGPDFAAFVRILDEALEKYPTRLLGWCLMSNHWHLVLWPTEDGELSAFMRWLTTTHVRRWHEHRHSLGRGHVYQGRFKSFPVQNDEHLLTVVRYVERNPLRAQMVQRAEHWHFSSLRQRIGLDAKVPPLTPLPTKYGGDWLEWVNEPQTNREMEQVRCSVERGRPFGNADWQTQTSACLGLEHTFRKRGRVKAVK